MEVPLTQGKTTVIDDADWPIVEPYKWHALKQPNDRWYAVTSRRNPETGKRESIRMNRLLLGLSDPDVKGDHRNLNTLDNRRENLRARTNAQNIRNRPKDSVPTSSQFKGVTWNRQKGKFVAQIICDGTYHYLGAFNSEIVAAQRYNDAATTMFGEFARLNVLPPA